MAPPPDILWIVTTQWRAQACGYAGDPNARTPHLDALAAQATNFAQAVTPHPFGPFARAALLTGVPSPENGVRDYFDPLPSGSRTIAHTLNERGYATAFLGKWHLGRRDPDAELVGEAHAKTIVPPDGRGGFGFWEGFESGFLLNDPWLHGTRLPEPVQFHGYQSNVLGERAATWIAEAGAARPPWFCVASLESPHPPYNAPAPRARRRNPAEIELSANVPRGGEAETKARRELAGYYTHIEATDHAIGALISATDSAAARQGRRPPLIVFTSVHGDMHGAHGLFRKGWPHEESVRVPLLIRRDSRQKGEKSTAAISLVDLPTMMLAEIDGREFSHETNGARISMPSVVALPHQCDRTWRGVRTPTRKLVLNADDSPWLFFDLESDPLETTNLANDPRRRTEIPALAALIQPAISRSSAAS